jgi:hypothetical protein
VGGIGLVFSILEAGAGHGSYSTARVFFPYTMILGDLFGEIGIGARVLGLVQYPAYAMLGWRAAARHRRSAFTLCVLLHLAAVLSAFALRTEVFP